MRLIRVTESLFEHSRNDKAIILANFPYRSRSKTVERRDETKRNWVGGSLNGRVQGVKPRDFKVVRRSIRSYRQAREREGSGSALRRQLVREGMVSRATARAVETVVRDADIRMPLDLDEYSDCRAGAVVVPLSVTRRHVAHL